MSTEFYCAANHPEAKLNPSNFADPKFDTDKKVITFFPKVVHKLLD